MDLDVTEIFNADSNQYFDSPARSGNAHIGEETWENAKRDGKQALKGQYDRAAFIDYFLRYGAWSSQEMEKWSDDEVAALMLQFVCSAVNDASIVSNEYNGEYGDAGWWVEYERLCEDGAIGGDLCNSEGRVFYVMQ